jgi:Tfp pilus assembly protein PilF
MSVVNQMLKDLERQQKTQPLYFNDDEVSDNKPSRRRYFPVRFATVIVLLLIASIGALGLYFAESLPAKSDLEQPLASSIALTETKPTKEESSGLITAAHAVESTSNKQLSVIQDSTHHPNRQANASAVTNNVDPVEERALSNHPIETKVIAASHSKESEPNRAVKQSTANRVADSALSIEQSNPTPTENNKQMNQNRSPMQHSVSNDRSVKQISKAQLKASRLEQARQWIALKNYAQAQQALNQLLHDFPDYHEAREQLAYVYLQTDNTEALQMLLTDAIQRYPHHATYRIVLAQHYANGQNWQSVLALTADNGLSNENLLLMRALAFQQLAQHEQAIEVYVRLLRDNATRGDWWIGFAVSLEALNRYQDAYQALVRAASDPRLTQQQKQYIQTNQRRLEGLL